MKRQLSLRKEGHGVQDRVQARGMDWTVEPDLFEGMFQCC